MHTTIGMGREDGWKVHRELVRLVDISNLDRTYNTFYSALDVVGIDEDSSPESNFLKIVGRTPQNSVT